MEETAVVIEAVSRLADAELIAGLQRWVRADRSVTARLLVHLGEVDARGLYRERAWSSMFAYTVEELHMSESEACVRIAAARLGRRFPRVVALLAEGAVHLTAIKLLGPHLTADNHVQVLERARGKTARAVERLVAELAPKPDVPSRMRKLPAPVSAHSAGIPVAPEREMNAASAPLFAASPQPQAGSSPAAMSASGPQSTEAAAASRLERNDVEHFQLEPAPRNVSSTRPLRPGRYKVEFTAGEAMHSKLEQLKALLRHQVPDGDLAIILERAADLLLEKTRKARFAQTTRPRVSKARASKTGVSADSGREARATAAHTSEAPAACAADAESRAARDGEVSKARASADSGREARVAAAHTSAAPINTACAVKAGAPAACDSKGTVNPAGANDTDGVRPRRAPSRYIPRSVVREVHARDGEQCTFVSPDGRRCRERGFLELHHHDTTYARGGAATTENLRMVCRSHNALFAEQDYGRTFIHSKLLHARLRKRDGANRPVSRREQE